jgi:hypothetical protein
MRWNTKKHRWAAGGTNATANGGSTCKVITYRSFERMWFTDIDGVRYPMDPAAIIGHELTLALDNIYDPDSPSDEVYQLDFQRRIQEELIKIEGPR